MLKPLICDFKSTKDYKKACKEFRKYTNTIKKEKLKDELVKMVTDNPTQYIGFVLPIFRIGLDSYTIKELQQFSYET